VYQVIVYKEQLLSVAVDEIDLKGHNDLYKFMLGPLFDLLKRVLNIIMTITTRKTEEPTFVLLLNAIVGELKLTTDN
jgi:hypothetical protein